MIDNAAMIGLVNMFHLVSQFLFSSLIIYKTLYPILEINLARSLRLSLILGKSLSSQMLWHHDISLSGDGRTAQCPSRSDSLLLCKEPNSRTSIERARTSSSYTSLVARE